MTKLFILISITCLIIACSSLNPEPTPTTLPTDTPTPTFTPIGNSSGLILFSRENQELEVMDIFILNIETGEEKNITQNQLKTVSYFRPRVSPDGKKILFERSEKGYSPYFQDEIWKSELFIMNIDGTSIQKISTSPLYRGKEDISFLITEVYADWSPSGKKIVFSSNKEIIEKMSGDLDNLQIFIMNLDTYEVTKIGTSKGSDEHPVWSPDGEKICLMSNRYGDWDLFVMDIDGKNLEQLTKSEATERFPNWSPDVKKIIFHTDIDGNLELYTLNLNSKIITRLTNNPARDNTASWSPDGQWILFVSDRDGDDEIYLMNIKSKEIQQLTNNQVVDGVPDWIP